jgi:hypothetical protein
VIGHFEQGVRGPLQGIYLPELIWIPHGDDWPEVAVYALFEGNYDHSAKLVTEDIKGVYI